MKNTQIFSNLTQDDLIQLELSLQILFMNLDTITGKKSLLKNAGIDDYFISNLDFNLNNREFITILVAKFKEYQISRHQPNYHPLICLLNYLLKQPSQRYNLDEQDREIFIKIIKNCQPQFQTSSVYPDNFDSQQYPSEINLNLNQYLTQIEQKLRTEGSLDIQQNINYKNQPFNLVSKITNFELPFGLFNMRGDAFVICSYFPSINIKTLQRYSNHCLQYATRKATSSPLGQISNFRVPCNVCFAIALVDQLEQETKNRIKTENPFDIETDTSWYKVPVVYCLSETKLYFYNQPSSFWENFKGEIVWKRLREVIETILTPDN